MLKPTKNRVPQRAKNKSKKTVTGTAAKAQVATGGGHISKVRGPRG